MSKKSNGWHIDINNKEAQCYADVQACPRGGADEHFATREEARKEATKRAMIKRNKTNKQKKNLANLLGGEVEKEKGVFTEEAVKKEAELRAKKEDAEKVLSEFKVNLKTYDGLYTPEKAYSWKRELYQDFFNKARDNSYINTQEVLESKDMADFIMQLNLSKYNSGKNHTHQKDLVKERLNERFEQYADYASGMKEVILDEIDSSESINPNLRKRLSDLSEVYPVRSTEGYKPFKQALDMLDAPDINKAEVKNSILMQMEALADTKGNLGFKGNIRNEDGIPTKLTYDLEATGSFDIATFKEHHDDWEKYMTYYPNTTVTSSLSGEKPKRNSGWTKWGEDLTYGDLTSEKEVNNFVELRKQAKADTEMQTTLNEFYRKTYSNYDGETSASKRDFSIDTGTKQINVVLGGANRFSSGRIEKEDPETYQKYYQENTGTKTTIAFEE